MRIKTGVVTLILLLMVCASDTYGQKNVQRDNFLWGTYNLSKPLNGGTVVSLSAQSRRFVLPDRQHQFKATASVIKSLNHGLSIGAGFSYFLQALPIDRSDVIVVRPELRPHQEISYGTTLGKWSIKHRFMAEERWIRNVLNEELTDGNDFSMRLRYRLLLERSLGEESTWTGVLSSEVMLNAANSEVNNIFDQNRLYFGLKNKVSSHISFDVGYIYWYQQFPSTVDYASFHILNLGVNHTL